MKIISPVFLTGHNYDEYNKKLAELSNEKDEICIDIDFLHENEIERYLVDTALGAIKNNFQVRSRDNTKVRNILKILKRHGVMYSSVGFGIEFYYVTIYN